MTGPVYMLRELQKVYQGRTVLRLPELAICEGETVALVGPSGAGKSTLIRLLGLLEAPTAGELTLSFDGQPWTAHSAPISVRRQVATVFQSPLLLSRSVTANVAYGLRLRGKAERGSVSRMLERIRMAPLANKHASTLSGGELQRVALARALVLEPRVLLLDEPSAHLDPYNVSLIETLLREQAQRAGTTCIIVTHNLMQARRLASRVVFLLDGELIETAPVDAFFEAPADPRTRAFLSGELVW